MNLPDHFSNPRREVQVDDWPFGRHTCKARFVVESHPKRGERVSRVTENKTRTGWNKPKCTTYAPRQVILDGDDGRVYLLSATRYTPDMIVVTAGTMKYATYLRPGDALFAEALVCLACYCRSLVDSRCDFCTGLRSIVEPRDVRVGAR